MTDLPSPTIHRRNDRRRRQLLRLGRCRHLGHRLRMGPQPRRARPGWAPETVRSRIERDGQWSWRLDDSHERSPQAFAQALSQLDRAGAIERLSKDVSCPDLPERLP